MGEQACQILQRVLVAIASVFVLTFSSLGQPIWEPLAGPEGGTVPCLVVSPTSGAIFACANYQFGYNHSAGSLFRSLDHGATWTRLGNELLVQPEITSTVRAIAVAPNGTIYAAFFGNGVFRSIDGGDHWSAVNAGLPTLVVREVAVSPGGEVFCCPEDTGVYQLNAQGTSWVAQNTGLTTLASRCLIFNGSMTFVGTRGGGIFQRSGNGPWVAANSGLGGLNINRFNIGVAGATTTLYACTDMGLFASTNNAATWTPVAGPFSNTVLTSCIALPNAIIVGGNVGTFRSVNGGPWNAVSGGFNGIVARSFVSDGVGGVLAGTTEGGICRSTDDGVTWTVSNTGLRAYSVLRLVAASDGTILAGTGAAGIIRSTTGGASWDPPQLINRYIFALAQAPWGELFAGNYNIVNGASDGHAYHSTDNGLSWTPLDAGMHAAMVSGFVFPGPTGRVMCSVAWNAGTVLNASSVGAPWTPYSSPPNIPAYFLGRAPNGDLYIGSEGLGVWRLPAAGGAWQNKGFTQSQQFAVAFNSQGHIFFGNDGRIRGVYRSTDNGTSFHPLDSFPSLYGHAILIAPDDTIYVGSRDVGIQRSIDNGDTWQPFRTGLDSTSCHSLSLGIDGHLYAGIAGHGVYRTVNPIIACPADFNLDSVVDFFDYLDFIDAFSADSPTADFNDDSVIDFFDYLDFVDAFSSGC